MQTPLAILGLLGSLLLAQGDEKSKLEWKEFAPKDFHFIVSLPGTPKTPGVGFNPFAHFIVRVKDVAYGITEFDFSDEPEEWKKLGRTPEERFDAVRKAILEDFGGKVLTEKKLTLDKNPGREIHIQTPRRRNAAGVITEYLHLRYRVYEAEKRIYRLGVGGPNEKVTSSKDADRFLGSFKLKSKAP